MKITNRDKASILSQALPYIRKYTGKVIVVKYGGHAMTNETLKSTVMGDLALLSLLGIRVILVHGGGPEINSTLEALNITSTFIDGLRYTDEATMKVVQQVMAGGISKDLAYRLNQAGGKAIGLCGLDNNLIVAKKQEHAEDLGQVGEITSINSTMLHELLNEGYIPVIATIGGDGEGQVYNINADTAAAEIAAAMNAENLSLMTDIPGLLEDVTDESTLIPYININQVPLLIQKEIISGGMIPKVKGCVEAIRKGVSKVFIMDGRVPHALLIEFFTNEGLGTMLIPNSAGIGAKQYEV